MLDPLSNLLLPGAGRRGPILLMYHSVQAGGKVPESQWSVSRQRFDAQMALLAEGGWNCCRVSDLVSGKPVPARTAVITFDDGYRDNLEPFEMLARMGMSATLFMVSGRVGGHADWQAVDGQHRPAMLDKAELQQMLAMGMEIGCHTRSHPRLTEVDDERLKSEVADARKQLQDLLNDPIASFAYPYGDHDQRVVDAVREAGYDAACVTRSGSGMVDGDPLRFRRIAVFAEDSLATFARKLVFADNDGSWSRVRRYYMKRLRDRLAA